MSWKYLYNVTFLLVGIVFCVYGQAVPGTFESDEILLYPGLDLAVGSNVTMQANYTCNGISDALAWKLGKLCMWNQVLGTSCVVETSQPCVTDSFNGRIKVSSKVVLSEGSKVLLTLTVVLNNLMMTDSETVFLVKKDETSINSSHSLRVKYCDVLTVTQADIFNITDTNLAGYETIALYFCNVSDDHYLVVNGTREDEPYNRSCQGDASWTGHNKVECWFAPKDVTVHQMSEYATEYANFYCNHTAGFPEAASEKYYIGDDDEVVDQSHELSSKDHLKNYSCTVQNGYGEPLRSSIKRLTVFFAPEDLYVDAPKQVIPVKESKDLKLYFNANSKNASVAATVYKPGNRLESMTCLVQTDSNTRYICNFTLTVISTADYGKYIFTASTSDPNGSDSISVEIFESHDDIPKPKSPNYALIGGLCGAALLLILLLLVFFLVRRRRLTKSAAENSVKEERINEIYGSAPATNGGDAAGSTQAKEERHNVLYVSSGDPGGIEEAYAEVDKKKNKKSNGNDNSAFSPEVADVTYAAVNKPKKKKKPDDPQEAVYSAVDKKKKKKGAKGESDLHGEPTIDP